MEKITVAIIGHGPSMKDKNIGRWIDLHSHVIRMSGCDWQNIEDYGTKFDIGVYSYGTSERILYKTKRHPISMYWHYITREDNKYGPDTEKTIEVNGRKFFVRCLRNTVWKYTNGQKMFTRGTAAFLGAVHYLKPDVINMFGCDDIKNGYQPSNKVEYAELKNYLKENKLHTNRMKGIHDWANEFKIINEIADQNNIEVNFI